MPIIPPYRVLHLTLGLKKKKAVGHFYNSAWISDGDTHHVKTQFWFPLPLFFFYPHLRTFLHSSSDRAGGREEEREKHRCERDTATGYHPHDPNRGRGQTAIEVRALSRNRTWDSLVHGLTLLSLSQTGQGTFASYNHFLP
uniref:Uncharacterized protein n=1 Tax=Molossus molossus TaxID=27622 RepID=A0A7J8FZP8_MOLMO|nr:hypothetical protein HJG59_008246 [Molossus molossus]